MVGSYEYYRALLRLERLVSISTPEQIEVYNKLLADRPEYTFHAGTFAESMTADSLDVNKAEDREKFDDRFLHRGLPWMMALARIELGATMSMYGDHRIEQPFTLLPPVNIEIEAFAAILWDDLEAHVVSLAGDPYYADVVKPNRKPDSWTMAYLRRMKLMTDMMKALDSVGNQQLSARMQPV